MDDNNHIVIIGAGIAGVYAAGRLRKNEFAGQITLIDRHQLPYDRPPLTKQFLREEMTEEEVLLHGEDFYVKKNITLKLGTEVTAIDSENKTVTLDDGETIAWRQLLIATGSKLRRLEKLDQQQFSNVYYIRTFEQGKQFKKAVESFEHIVIIGAGFIGLEVAASLTMIGKKVTVLEPSETPLMRILGKEMGDYIAAIHRKKGVELLTNTLADQFIGNGKIEKVVTKHGKTIECDGVLVSIGVTPDLTLVDGILKTEQGGIVVDEYGQTSVKDIYAAGDCARWPDPISGEWIRVEHWEHAYGQGGNVAQNMIEEQSKPYTRIPYFWSDQYDFQFEYLGHPLEWDQTVLRGELAADKFILFYLQKKKIVGAFFVNASDEVAIVKKLMKSGRLFDEIGLGNLSKTLGDLLET